MGPVQATLHCGSLQASRLGGRRIQTRPSTRLCPNRLGVTGPPSSCSGHILGGGSQRIGWFLPGDQVMRILTGGTRVGSLPRGSSGLLNILPVGGEKRRNLEVKVRPLGPWADPGVRDASNTQLPERGKNRNHEMKGLPVGSRWHRAGGALWGRGLPCRRPDSH